MTLYVYKIGTNIPVLTVENAQSYTADSVTAADGAIYRPLADDCEPARRTARRLCGQTTVRRIRRRRPVWTNWRSWWPRCCSEVRANEYGCGAAVPRGTAESGAG